MKHNRGFSRWLNDTTRLNRLYIETRYPSDIDLRLSEERVGEICGIARELYDFVCTELYGETAMEGE